MSWDLKNKNAVITGGTKGIGWAIANNFLSLGANVTVIARNQAQLDTCIEAWKLEGYDVVGIIADLTNFEDYEKIASQINYTRVDILVNNVGGNTPKPFNAYTLQEINQVFNLNIISNIQFTQLLFEKLKAATNSTVINISSVAGIEDVGTGSMYAICKAALIQLTKSLAVEWAPYGIRVNSVAPWFTATDRINHLLKDKQLEQFVLNNTPLKTIASTADIANAVAFLAMDQAAYISGEVLVLDGAYLANQ
jgi:NAD(P)-dependent dehydrogenase (short-subunit alcohol dehydrogenase family)